MVPAFPMDGGRLLRSILNYFLGFMRATFYAVRVSEGISLCLVTVGIFTMSPSLILVPMFVMLFAEAELRNARINEAKKLKEAEKEKEKEEKKEKIILDV
jgi:Zn-dependent protease